MTDSLFSSAVLGTAIPVELTWSDLVIRVACTLVAGAIIGYDRGERGKAAGLRTTVFLAGRQPPSAFSYCGACGGLKTPCRSSSVPRSRSH
jgi:hypothetical protein